MIFLLCFHFLGDVVCSGEVFEDHREERVPGSSLGEVYNHGWGIWTETYLTLSLPRLLSFICLLLKNVCPRDVGCTFFKALFLFFLKWFIPCDSYSKGVREREREREREGVVVNWNLSLCNSFIVGWMIVLVYSNMEYKYPFIQSFTNLLHWHSCKPKSRSRMSSRSCKS